MRRCICSHIPVGTNHQRPFPFICGQAFDNRIGSFAPAGKKHFNAFYLITLSIQRISISTVKNNRNVVALYFFIGREQFEQRLSALLQINTIQGAQFRGLADQIVPVDDDVNCHFSCNI